MKKAPKYTQETAINLLYEIYPNLNFSDSQYKNQLDKIKVICPKHGEFYKSFFHMAYMKQGCPKCSKENRVTNTHKFRGVTHEQFIEITMENNANPLISFEKTIFSAMNKKVIITCSKHGDVEVLARRLYKGEQNCKFCGVERSSVTRSVSIEEFKMMVTNNKKISPLIHIDYNSFTSMKSRVSCECEEHGKFETYPVTLLSGCGCPSCARKTRGESKSKRVGEGFLERVKNVHGDKYDLSLAVYTGSKNKCILICKNHGPFEITPSNLYRGQGCPYCSGRLLCPTDFQKQVDMVHGEGRYTCNTFEPMSTTVTTTCNKCGNKWEAYHQSLRRGIGCPNCESEPTGFKPDRPGTLYNIKFTLPDGTICYKVGITNHSVEYRLLRMEVDEDIEVEILERVYYEVGYEAYEQEQALLRDFSSFRFNGRKFLVSGYTELFTVNPFTYAL